MSDEKSIYQVTQPQRVNENVQLERIKERLERDFTYHAPKDNQVARYEHIRRTGLNLAECIVDLSPGSREQSLALTKVEEAVMWANAAIARNE